MQLTINGESKQIATAQTIAALVEALALNSKAVAIEHNRVIVPKSAYASTPIADGDAIEIVEFIGGG